MIFNPEMDDEEDEEVGAEESKVNILRIVGVLATLGGWILLVNPTVDSSSAANIQKLFMGATLAITVALFFSLSAPLRINPDSHN